MISQRQRAPAAAHDPPNFLGERGTGAASGSGHRPQTRECAMWRETHDCAAHTSRMCAPDGGWSEGSQLALRRETVFFLSCVPKEFSSIVVTCDLCV